MFLLRLRQLPRCGDRTAASVLPPIEGRSSPSNTAVFLPTSFLLPSLCGSIYSFPLVRYPCPLSAGVLYACLCLKVCSWCIHRERCTPGPPTPLPSCSPPILNKKCFDCVINCGCFYNALLKLFIQINSPIRASFFLLLSSGLVYSCFTCRGTSPAPPGSRLDLSSPPQHNPFQSPKPLLSLPAGKSPSSRWMGTFQL